MPVSFPSQLGPGDRSGEAVGRGWADTLQPAPKFARTDAAVAACAERTGAPVLTFRNEGFERLASDGVLTLLAVAR